MANTLPDERILVPQWSSGLIVLSYGISWLGAYTSTQIVIHAKYTRPGPTRWLWIFLASVAFGFSAIWSMHFVGMLACGLDVKIYFNHYLTIFSAFVAIIFTFAALSSAYASEAIENSKPVLEVAKRGRQAWGWATGWFKRSHEIDVEAGGYMPVSTSSDAGDEQHQYEPDGHDHGQEDDNDVPQPNPPKSTTQMRPTSLNLQADQVMFSEAFSFSPLDQSPDEHPAIPVIDPEQRPTRSLNRRGPTRHLENRPPPSAAGESSASLSTDESDSIHTLGRHSRSNSQGSHSNSLSSTVTTSSTWNDTLHAGLSRETRMRIKAQATDRPVPNFGWKYWIRQHRKAITTLMMARAAIWALAIAGMWAMEIPLGRIVWDTQIVILSYVVAFVVCFVACLAMVHMEVHFGRQVAFSTIAATGISSMHYTGMAAATFYTRAPPDPRSGYPTYLPFVIVGVAVFVCVISNAVLAHAVINSRNRMAEMILTKRRLWRIMAEKEAAEQANELKQQFISVASHEIRTPLHAVNGYCDLLALTSLTEEQALYVKSIQQACHAINVIAGNVLDFSKLDRNNVELSARPVLVDLRKMVENLARIMENNGVQPGQPCADVIVSVADNVPPAVYLDETYTFRILMNLLSNAQKFCDSGYICVSVTQGTHDQIVMKVSDTGCGIPKSFRAALFQPFRQADSSLTRPRQGTGLGLSIVKHLLQRMNGTVEVESTEGFGSTFTITLPITTPSRSPTVTTKSLPLQKTVNIVYRHERTSKLFIELFAQFGCVATASSGDVSLQELVHNADIIWSDVETVIASPALRELLNARNHKMHPPLVIVHSDTSELTPLEPELSSARGVILVKRPVIMHNLISVLENPQAHTGVHVVEHPMGKVRFALPDDVVTPSEEKEKEKGGYIGSPVPRVAIAASPPRPPTPPPRSSPVQVAEDKPAVLLVEDNMINQHLGKRLLEKLGYAVVTASDGQQAVERAMAQSFICCLMDCQMPVLDGFAATAKIRELESNGTIHGRLPIIALTANVSPDSEERCRAAGMDHFLPKPLRLGELGTTLSQYGHDPH
ncbi:histidine kinase [Cristinia sonorae]|uniref:Histidine kinase n=1 Tax=Cristinia sonorae TaxID=1940300 RepID=A0A8K0ULP6_9AGAR|nr:histidine kinase [Cristinia sonorae]